MGSELNSRPLNKTLSAFVNESVHTFETSFEDVKLIPGITNRFYVNEIVNLPFIADGEFLKVFRNGSYEPIFLKGVNLGVAVPGTQPGELAASREQYAHWLQEIADADLNYIRTYTLHYPRFYEELENYNLANDIEIGFPRYHTYHTDRNSEN